MKMRVIISGATCIISGNISRDNLNIELNIRSLKNYLLRNQWTEFLDMKFR